MLQQVNFVPGDTVRVHQKIAEGDKTRVQIFEGVILSIRGRGENKTYTVRKVIGDVAVERIWQVGSPVIEKVVVKEHSKKRVRRAKLYYLRNAK